MRSQSSSDTDRQPCYSPVASPLRAMRRGPPMRPSGSLSAALAGAERDQHWSTAPVDTAPIDTKTIDTKTIGTDPLSASPLLPMGFAHSATHVAGPHSPLDIVQSPIASRPSPNAVL